jgi:hypothetical protein
MRRFVVTTVIAVGIGSMATLPAGAASPNHLERLVDGSFTGRQGFTFGTDGCSFVHQTFSLSGGDRHHTADLAAQGCVSVTGGGAGPLFTYSGTFVLTVGKHDTATGIAAGTTQGGDDGLHLVLTVTSGTGQFRRVGGTIDLDGTWSNDSGVLGTGPASGTVTADLRRV